MSNVRATYGNICKRWDFISDQDLKSAQDGADKDQSVLQMTANVGDDDWQDEAGSVKTLPLQSWLTRDERQMAARINMTYARPEQFQPSCGTSDPSIMQVSEGWAGKCQIDN